MPIRACAPRSRPRASNRCPRTISIARSRKGTGELEGVTLEELSYEGYGPGGVAIILDALTDNRNRLVSELRFIFSRHGGNLGENGSVGWMFKKHGVITIEKNATDEDKLLEIALDAGADDVSSDADSFQVTTPPDKLHAVRDAIEKAGIAIGTRRSERGFRKTPLRFRDIRRSRCSSCSRRSRIMTTSRASRRISISAIRSWRRFRRHHKIFLSRG